MLTACPPVIDTGADGGNEIVVGPNGGIFVRLGAVLDIPRGAVDEETRIFVTIVDTGIPDVPGRTRISFGYKFSPTTLKFKAPVRIGDTVTATVTVKEVVVEKRRCVLEAVCTVNGKTVIEGESTMYCTTEKA